jgi:hypothetical protein
MSKSHRHLRIHGLTAIVADQIVNEGAAINGKRLFPGGACELPAKPRPRRSQALSMLLEAEIFKQRIPTSQG